MSLSAQAEPVTIIACALLPEGLEHANATERLGWHTALPNPQSSPAARALAKSQVLTRQRQAAYALNATHEHAFALAMGWPNPDGLLPLAAHAAKMQGLSCPTNQGWAFLDLVHWAIQQGQVHVQAAGQISPAEDQALLEAIAPFALEDGIQLVPHLPGRWLAHAQHFKGLPSVSVDQVMGRNASPWLQTDEVANQSDAQRLLRRLQNEIQMLLYQHPVNDRRQHPLNSIWWSGTGDLSPMSDTQAVHLHRALQPHHVALDPQAWGEAWQSLSQAVIGPALADGHTLVLCGEQRQLRLKANPDRWWRSWLPVKPLSQLLA
ncbi:MAG: hypothetical protein EBZ60_05335 [Betaproteobacteria bacterium]|nr:hypothetical protein [Betaproteobacteria bacterium]